MPSETPPQTQKKVRLPKPLYYSLVFLGALCLGLFLTPWKKPPNNPQEIFIKSPISFTPNIADREFWERHSSKQSQTMPPKNPEENPDFYQSVQRLREGTLQLCVYDNMEVWKEPILKELESLSKEPWPTSTQGIRLEETQSAAEIATCLFLLAPILPNDLKTTLQEKINTYCIYPYLQALETQQTKVLKTSKKSIVRGFPLPWIDLTDNFKAICISNIITASLAINPPEFNKTLVEDSLPLLEDYLDSFHEDGTSAGGYRYWLFGFSHYTRLAELLLIASNHSINLYNHPKIPPIIAFPYHAHTTGYNPSSLIGYPNFADNPNRPQVGPDPITAIHRLRFNNLPRVDNLPNLNFLFSLQMLNPPKEWNEKTTIEIQKDPLRSFFPSTGLFIARDPKSGIALASNGGKNSGLGHDEHNHNDIGTYSLSQAGYTVFGDPGERTYDERSFGTRKNEAPRVSSYDHPVPVINHHLQTHLPSGEGKVVKKNFSPQKDSITYDLTSAYECLELESLERTIEFERDPTRVVITDRFRASEPIMFETAILYKNKSLQKVKIESSQKITTLEEKADPFYRVGLKLDKPNKSGWIRQTVVPNPSPNTSRP